MAQAKVSTGKNGKVKLAQVIMAPEI